MTREVLIVAILIGDKIIYKSEKLDFSQDDILKYSKQNKLNFNDQRLYIEKLGKNSNDEDIIIVMKRNYPDYNYKIEQFEHDIREPLKNISNFLSLIESSVSSGKTEQVQEYINFALDAVIILNNFAKKIFDKQTSTNQAIKLNDIITDIKLLDKFQFEKYNVKVQCDNNLPKITGDYFDFISLFKNLIENSIKHSNNEKIIITIKAKSTTSDFIVVSFVNNSILNSDDIKNIESVLENEIGVVESKGLKICKSIIKKYKGQLKFNKENGNVSYDINLPLWRTESHENS